jgi:hypothetical protein
VGVGVTEGVGVGVGVGVTEGVGVGVGVGVTEGVGVGVATGRIATPLLQTIFFFDLIQVYVLPLKTCVALSFGHFAPGTGALAAKDDGALKIARKRAVIVSEVNRRLIRRPA